MTEITDTTNTDVPRGVIFFDATCAACTAGATRFHRLLGRRGFTFLPLQAPEATALTHLGEDELRREMKLRLADGRILGGVDAIAHLARTITWTRPLAWLADRSLIRPILVRIYKGFARNRSHLSPTCKLDRETATAADWIPWLTPIAAIVLACISARWLAPWIAMWAIAFAIFASLKLLTWWPYRATAQPIRSIAYLIGWAGLDAKRFLFARSRAPVEMRATVPAIIHLLSGATLLWGFARLLPLNDPHLIAWAGMIGIILMLHFGVLQLLSLAWQHAGVDAPLVMARPLASTSLADFWNRWNRPFTALAFTTIFRPLRRFSVGFATLATFFVSGLVHDLAISVPAGAGFGRPTLYFLIQAVGILVERTLRFTGVVRRLFAALILIAPIALLFHSPFLDRVVLPMMHAIGALGKELP